MVATSMPRPILFRLGTKDPNARAAKIWPLCEIFPKKTKTDIIGDLLATALDDVEEGLSSELYPWEEETGPDEVWGDRKKYYDLANKYLKELEAETGELESAEEEKRLVNKMTKRVPRQH